MELSLSCPHRSYTFDPFIYLEHCQWNHLVSTPHLFYHFNKNVSFIINFNYDNCDSFIFERFFHCYNHMNFLYLPFIFLCYYHLCDTQKSICFCSGVSLNIHSFIRNQMIMVMGAATSSGLMLFNNIHYSMDIRARRPSKKFGARCSSVERAFARGAMGRRIDPSWGGPMGWCI